MELKLYANTEPRKKFHMVRKLSKASKYAEDLKNLCNIDQVDARTKLEVQVSITFISILRLKFAKKNKHNAKHTSRLKCEKNCAAF